MPLRRAAMSAHRQPKNPRAAVRICRLPRCLLDTSLARPGGNATGINFFTNEVVTKRLRLLHDLVPKAIRVAVLLNPANAPSAEATLRDVQEAAPALGLQIQTLNATTIGEIDAAFATLAREHPDAAACNLPP
jgi:putative ABC transport system substrate-binding protein